MRLLFILGLVSIPSFATPYWQTFSGKPGEKCEASYTFNMKPVGRPDAKHVKVSQKSIGFQPMGIIELTSAKQAMFGEGFLDIGVQHVKAEGGVDYWKECRHK